MQKMRLFQQFALEKKFILKSYNLIGWERLGFYLRNKIFSNKEFVEKQSK